MTDFMVPLPANWRYVYQFDGNSQYKCVEASLAMAAQIAYPDRYAHPAQLMSQIYTQYVGPDVAGDRNGTTREQALAWLDSQHIGYIDMQAGLSNLDELKAEIQAQNLQHIPQLISIGDESFLKYAKNEQPLHNWADALNHGSHTFLRVGYSDNEGWAYYMEPAAAPSFAEPIPIKWSDIEAGAVVGCIAIMPHGVKPPPAGFSFQHGTWPAPKPVFDVAAAENTLAAIMHALQAAEGAVMNLAHDLAALKGEV